MDALSAMSLELLDHARVVAVMETLPFDVTTALIDAIPEGRLARTATAPTRSLPDDWGALRNQGQPE